MHAATKEDAQAIADLDMVLFPEGCFNERTLALEIAAGGGLVIYNQGELRAYLLARWDRGLQDITRVGVHPDSQGQGLGTKMLRDALDCSALDTMLCVRRFNTRALRLYERLGFIIVSQTGDSWVMRRAT